MACASGESMRLPSLLLVVAAGMTACTGSDEADVAITGDVRGNSVDFGATAYGIIVDHGSHQDQQSGIPPRLLLNLLFAKEGPLSGASYWCLDVDPQCMLELGWMEFRAGTQVDTGYAWNLAYRAELNLTTFDVTNVPEAGDWSPEVDGVTGTIGGTITVVFAPSYGELDDPAAIVGTLSGTFSADHVADFDSSVTE
jgi:hypothetical protein